MKPLAHSNNVMVAPGRMVDNLFLHFDVSHCPPDKCSIVVPVFNKVSLTRDWLANIRETCAGTNYEVIIVDNASTDMTRDVFASDQFIKYVRLSRNIGIGAAMNVGFGLAVGSFITFMHNDLFPLASDWLRETVCKMSLVPKVGATGLCHSVHKSKTGPLAKRTVYCLDGMCMTFSRQAFEAVGGFDEQFQFTGYYDFDICYSLALSGYETAISWFQAKHLNHATSDTPEFRQSTSGLDWPKIVSRNRLLFLEKWGISY